MIAPISSAVIRRKNRSVLMIIPKSVVLLCLLALVSPAVALGVSDGIPAVNKQYKIESRTMNNSLCYPALVVGDPENSIFSIASSPYLTGRQVVFFSKAFRAKEPLSLLRYANTVIFYDGAGLDLALDLLPSVVRDSHGNEVVIRFLPQASERRFHLFSQDHYEVFMKAKKGSSVNSLKLDRKQFHSSSILPKESRWENLIKDKGKKGRWRYMGDIFLFEGEHSFETDENVEEVIIISREGFGRHYNEVNKLLSRKAIVVSSGVHGLEPVYNGLKSVRPADSREEPKIQFTKVNPTKYIVRVEAKIPYWLVFSESFHRGWKVYFRAADQQSGVQSEKPKIWETWFKKPLPESRHFLVNGYANSWRIEKTGNYEIILEFWPQRLLYLGGIVSGITLLFCVGYLVWDWRKRKWQKLETRN